MPKWLLAAVVVLAAQGATATSPSSLRRLQVDTGSSGGSSGLPGTVGPEKNSSAISYAADGPATQPTTTHHSTPLVGPIALGAIGILVVGIAAAVARQKKAKEHEPES